MKFTMSYAHYLSITLLAAPLADAATLNVTPGKGCNNDKGLPFCTIQAAIDKAAPGDTLRLAPGRHLGPIAIEKALTLVGSAQGDTIIDAQKNGSGITVAPATTVTLNRLVVRNGFSENGGGILNRGDLTVDTCRIVRNTATQNGGGIYNGGTFSSRLTVIDSEISDNIAQGDDKFNVKYGGGGIYNDGPLTIRKSMIRKNRASENGGGLYSVFSGRSAPSKAESSAEQMGLTTIAGPMKSLTRVVDENSVVIERSTITENAADTGGGINVHGVLHIENTLVARNRAVDNDLSAGGGLFAHFDTRLRIANSVFVKNQAQYGGAGLRFYSTGYGRLINVTVAGNSNNTTGHAAGVFVVHDTAQLELSHSLVAENVALGQPADCGGRIVSLGFNLLGNNNGHDCRWQNGEGDLIGTRIKPIVSQLEWNKTRDLPSLARTSPAIDAGDQNGCKGFDDKPLTTDYLGAPRPVTASINQAPRCDIGAIEWQPTDSPKQGKKKTDSKRSPKQSTH